VLHSKQLGLDLTEYVDAEFRPIFVLKVKPTPTSLLKEVLVIFTIGQEADTGGSDQIRERVINTIGCLIGIVSLDG